MAAHLQVAGAQVRGVELHPRGALDAHVNLPREALRSLNGMMVTSTHINGLAVTSNTHQSLWSRGHLDTHQSLWSRGHLNT